MKLVDNQSVLVKTNAGECYCPSRLTYRIKSKNLVLNKLGALYCFYKDPEQKRWMIECSGETLEITNWGAPYIQALTKGDPILVGYATFPSKHTMHVFVRSYERVTPVLMLLDKYLPRHIAMGTHHDSSYNLVVVRNRHECPSPEAVFADESKIVYSKYMRKVDELEEKARLTGRNYEQQIDEMFKQDFLAIPLTRTSQPDIVKTRLEAFYTDGAKSYEQSMTVRRTMALAKHFGGGKLNTLEFFEKLTKNEGKKIDNFETFMRS